MEDKVQLHVLLNAMIWTHLLLTLPFSNTIQFHKLETADTTGKLLWLSQAEGSSSNTKFLQLIVSS